MRNTNDRSSRRKNRRQVSRHNSPDKFRASETDTTRTNIRKHSPLYGLPTTNFGFPILWQSAYMGDGGFSTFRAINLWYPATYPNEQTFERTCSSPQPRFLYSLHCIYIIIFNSNYFAIIHFNFISTGINFNFLRYNLFNLIISDGKIIHSCLYKHLLY